MGEVAAGGVGLWSALIAAASALIVFWLTAFVGEDYRRWRDATELAASLAGEVKSFKAAMAIGESATQDLLNMLEATQPIPRKVIPPAPQTVFSANLQRLGLLGTSIGKDLPFAYHMIYAYRVASENAFGTDDPAEQKAALLVALKMAENANSVLPGLLSELEILADRWWRPFSRLRRKPKAARKDAAQDSGGPDRAVGEK